MLAFKSFASFQNRVFFHQISTSLTSFQKVIESIIYTKSGIQGLFSMVFDDFFLIFRFQSSSHNFNI